MRLYNSQLSGNCYKARLLLTQLGVPFERIEVDVVDRTRRAELLGDKNPALRVPVLELDDGSHLAESNAILWYLAEGTPYAEELEAKRKGGYAALDAMERHLEGRSFLVAERYTIADISLYAYTHVADEGGFDLGSYPAVRRWLAHVAAQPGHVPIDA